MQQKSLIEIAKAFGTLSACMFSLFMIFAAPYELFMVQQVKQWTPVQVTMTFSGYRRSDFKPYRQYINYQFEDNRTGRPGATADLRPGDLPLSVSAFERTVFDQNQKTLRVYRAGTQHTIFSSPDGERYVLEQGEPVTMTIYFLMSLSWWAWLLLMRQKANQFNALKGTQGELLGVVETWVAKRLAKARSDAKDL